MGMRVCAVGMAVGREVVELGEAGGGGEVHHCMVEEGTAGGGAEWYNLCDAEAVPRSPGYVT